LVPVPFGEDHLRLLGRPNFANKLWYDHQENGIGFEGTVDDQVAKKIADNVYKGLSIELNFFRKGNILRKVNGVAPLNFDVTSIHFTKRFPPADQDAYVKMWEGLVLPIVPQPLDVQIDEIRQFFEERLRYLEGQVAAMTRNEGFMQAPAPAIIIFKEAETKFTTEITKLREKLADFDKLKEAYHAEQGKPEKEFTQKGQILAERIEDYTEGLKVLEERVRNYRPEGEATVKLRKQLYEAEEKVDELTKEKREMDRKAREAHNDLRNKLLAVIPPPRVWMSWRVGGPKVMVQRLLGVLEVKPEDYAS